MPTYLVSDVHLRLDHPERSERFAAWVRRLGPGDRLVIGGDLCDFWFASRQRGPGRVQCAGLLALRRWVEQGGVATIMPGNHDAWLGPYYEQTLGARFVHQPLELEAHGLRVHVVHGHLLGARNIWKAAMESRLFLHGFGWAPGRLARWLESRLDESNDRHRQADDERHLAVYRRYAQALGNRVDLAVFGHIHRPCDEPGGRPRLVVLGGWRQGTSYLRIDDTGAALVIERRAAGMPA